MSPSEGNTLSLMEGFRPDRIDGAFINFIKKKVRERL
jgi:hypothetical protein